MPQQHPAHESGHVRDPSDPVFTHVKCFIETTPLRPQSEDHKQGARYKYNPWFSYQQQTLDVGHGSERKAVRADQPGDHSTGTNQRNRAFGVQKGLAQARDQPGGEVQPQQPPRSDAFFNGHPERPQHDKVAHEMEKRAMQEHVPEQIDDVTAEELIGHKTLGRVKGHQHFTCGAGVVQGHTSGVHGAQQIYADESPDCQGNSPFLDIIIRVVAVSSSPVVFRSSCNTRFCRAEDPPRLVAAMQQLTSAR